MALTLAQQNQLRKRAAKEAAATAPAASMAGANSYELQLAQLLQDRLRIKNVHSNEGKAELKRQLLPAYEPYIQGVLAAGQGAQDEVLTTIMVWRLDAGDYAGALEVAAYVIQHNLGMPDRFARTSPCLVAEEIAEAALKALKAGGEFPLDVLERAHQLTAEQDMPDEARAKLHLAIGKAFGLDEAWGARVLSAVGNYGEIFDRNLGPATKLGLERGQNALWSKGGLLYSPPFQ